MYLKTNVQNTLKKKKTSYNSKNKNKAAQSFKMQKT